MEPQFYKGNRDAFMEKLAPGSLALFFSGVPVRKTADEDYAYFANRNFVYLTGMEQKDTILMLEKDAFGYRETLFILPPNLIEERWTGARMKPEEIEAASMISNFAYRDTFEEELKKVLASGRIEKVYLDIDRMDGQVVVSGADSMETFLKQEYPNLLIENSLPILKKLRLIKKPCEIRAMEKAQEITKAGILAMMTHSKPGMYEYQYKAEFDYALAQHGCLAPAFPSIISAGANNFCIHYYEYTGQAKDGDMILNDVGAQYDHLFNDVSRGWPCNGKFSERQRLLYTCAYRTSQHMFSIIRPGMKMADVDRLAREYNFEQLKAIGLCDRYEDVGRYIWHGGAHHVGWDTHDLVDVDIVEPGMVFCVDIGIYCEEWGIGFRLEDNCLVTEDSCENLTASIPRTIEEIESVMGGE